MEPQAAFVIDYYAEARERVFVDVGAHDGITCSISLPLEQELGWVGLCVEPNPAVFPQLAKNRRVQCLQVAAASTNGRAPFCHVTGYSAMLSGLEAAYDPRHRAGLEREVRERDQFCENIMVDVRRLDSILDKVCISEVDYLCVDVEGGELGVLEGAALDRRRFELISVEDNFNEGVCDKLLRRHGYRFLSRVCADNFWCRRSPA